MSASVRQVLVMDAAPATPEEFSVPGVDFIRFDPSIKIPDDLTSAEGLVVWGSADEARRAVEQLPQLSWIQYLMAGIPPTMDTWGLDQVTVCSGSSLHDSTVAEHTLALVLAAARRLHVLMDAKQSHTWRQDIGGSQPDGNDEVFSTLHGANVVIWGYGSIGSTLAPLLTSLGAEVTGVARSARTEGGIRVVTNDDLPELLPSTDVLVMILPDHATTYHALSESLMALLPSSAWVVNVGRGSTIDEEALAQAVAAGRIGGAALDVFEVEPLPSESPLWDIPNVIITPHAAGGRPRGAWNLIAENARAWLANEPLRNVQQI